MPSGLRNSSSNSSPGVTGGKSVIVDDFDGFRVAVDPAETDAELIVDSDAVLATAVSFERFQAVAGWDAQVVKSAGNLQLAQLPASNGLESLEPPNTASACQSLCVAAAVQPNRLLILHPSRVRMGRG